MPNRREFLASTAALAASSRFARASDKPRIKIGQIGTGHAHASKLGVYRKSSDYEVVGVVEPDAALRKQAEASEVYRGLPFVTQDELLTTPGLQAVLVETRVRDSLNAAEACVNAGKHIHLDKPAGASLPQFRKILQVAESKKLIVQMGYMYRYNPAVVLLRQFLAEGWLGDVYEVHAVMSKVVDPAARKELAEFRGGIMFELGCHVLDTVIAILGPPEQVTPVNRHSSKLDDGLVDNMLAVLHYPQAIATVKASAQEIDGGERRHLVVVGTEGTFHIQPLDNPSARVTLSKPCGPYKKGYQEIRFPKYTRYVDDAADMARVIRGETAFGFSYDHDRITQETLLKACEMPLN
ncbi:MAG TPA: Gfo/Idh/MocA family oxidoreductase [Planctomycetaceae bacterium]|nr:Gfo/Idh/MocA family oxidoreductase [Planctomycetaceae bacterium]